MKIFFIAIALAGVFTLVYSVIKDNTTANGKTEHVQHNKKNGYKSVKPFNSDQWNEQSDGEYPDLNGVEGLQVEVSIPRQRVFIKDGDNKVIYTMYCSTGKDDSTPRGDFTIKESRGDTFFNKKLNEGAKNWTSFSDDNVYLFHSVPTDANGNFTKEGKKDFGRPASHGCIRLSVPDSEWFMNNIPAGTKVKIH